MFALTIVFWHFVFYTKYLFERITVFFILLKPSEWSCMCVSGIEFAILRFVDGIVNRVVFLIFSQLEQLFNMNKIYICIIYCRNTFRYIPNISGIMYQ